MNPSVQTSELICGRDKIRVGLNVTGTTSSDLDPFSGNLADRNCSRFTTQFGMVWYEVELEDGTCGNVLRVGTCP